MFNYLLENTNPGFPEQLKQIRLSLKINNEEFASICKVSRSCIRRYEDKNSKDTVNPRLKNWLKIKEGLDKIKYFDKKQDEISLIPYKTFWQYVKPYITANEKIIS
jgi:predicted transcriptional regulator